MKFKCGVHNKLFTNLGSELITPRPGRALGCSQCKRGRRTLEVVISSLPEHIKCIGKPAKQRERVDVKCTRCKHRWKAQLENLSGCPSCEINTRQSLDFWQKRAGNKVEVLDYADSKRLKVRCVKCSDITIKYQNSLGHHGCVKCDRPNVPVIEKSLSVERAAAQGFKLLGKYVSAKECSLKCLHCNHVFISRVQTRRMPCPNCEGRYYTVDGIKMLGYEGAWYRYAKSKNPKLAKGLVPGSDKNALLIDMSKYKGRRYHRPDFYCPLTNTCIEVKSPWTLTMNAATLKRVLNNIDEATRRGFKYKLEVIHENNTRLELPVDWDRYTHTKLRNYLMKQAPRQLIEDFVARTT